LPFADADDSTPPEYIVEQIDQTKKEIEQLRAQINLLKQNQGSTESLPTEIKDQLAVISDDIESISANVTDASLSEHTQDIKTLSNDLDDIVSENATEVQREKWQDTNSTIYAEIYDPQGKLIQTISEYEKLREGKFKIKLAPEQVVRAGVYHIKTILEIDNTQYVIEDEFAWGLVSVNTKKSIYKPGENAEFVIVVLDNQGHPVCDANISMMITDPQFQNTTLDTNNGISRNPECGLYDAQYLTELEGDYALGITAQTPNGITNFDTQFTVKSNYDYDIIRTAQSKIDPTINPNSFEVKIDVESFVGGDIVTNREILPNKLDVVTDGLVLDVK
jgi:hypothetical protein